MKFNNYSELENKHAFLGGSNYHWLNYTPDKLKKVYNNSKAKEEGIELHNFAETAIRKRVKLAKLKKTLNMFVNDSIGFNMEPEMVLYYSDNIFGTADALSFRDNTLKIFDLKTGVSKCSFKQLDIYTAIFCLEYGIKPNNINIEQRIYQSNKVEIATPNPDYIIDIMHKIEEFDIIIDNLKFSNR